MLLFRYYTELMCIYRRFECLLCFRVFIKVDSEHGDSMLRSNSDKYVTICGRHEHRNTCRSLYEIPALAFLIKFWDNPFRGIRLLQFTHMYHFNDNSPPFLKMILQKPHLLHETPFLNFSGSLSTGRFSPT
jgi:hypothetical protein